MKTSLINPLTLFRTWIKSFTTLSSFWTRYILRACHLMSWNWKLGHQSCFFIIWIPQNCATELGWSCDSWWKISWKLWCPSESAQARMCWFPRIPLIPSDYHWNSSSSNSRYLDKHGTRTNTAPSRTLSSATMCFTWPALSDAPELGQEQVCSYMHMMDEPPM